MASPEGQKRDVAGIQRERRETNLSHLQASVQRWSNTNDPSLIPVPLWPGYKSYIAPSFLVGTAHRVYVETPEDGFYQEWTGVQGQEANPWELTGYAVVLVRIESQGNDGAWTPCNYKVGRHLPPNPNPTVTVYGYDKGTGVLGAEVAIVPEYGPPS